MTEQEIADLKTKAAQLEVENETTKAALKVAEDDKKSTVTELQALRTKKQEVEAELALAKSKLTPDNASQGNVEETVKKVLEAKETQILGETRVKLEQKFKDAHTEFRPENDAGGIKYAAFQQKLARMNLSSLKTEEEIWEAFNDAMVILNKGKTDNQIDFNPYAATTKNSSGEPRGADNNKLSANEVALIKQLGWTEERYLKVKKAQPHFVESMLTQVK